MKQVIALLIMLSLCFPCMASTTISSELNEDGSLDLSLTFTPDTIQTIMIAHGCDSVSEALGMIVSQFDSDTWQILESKKVEEARETVQQEVSALRVSQPIIFD